MITRNRILVTVAGIALTAAAFQGCMSIQNHSALEALNAVRGKSPVYTEAFVEYAGPNEKWAGPGSLLVHITAKDGDKPVVKVTPELLSLDASRSNLSMDEARAQLAEMASALGEEDQSFEGCLSPVRVRLVRQEGAVLEKHGCRSQSGWPGIVSRVVGNFIGKSAAQFAQAPAAGAAKEAVAPAEAHGAAKPNEAPVSHGHEPASETHH